MINLRDVYHYKHQLSDSKQDYIAYGLKFENMRRILTLRAPFVINNNTDTDYKIRLKDEDKKISEKIIELNSGSCYPISLDDMRKRFSICSMKTENEWSNQIKIRTIVERLPKNTTVTKTYNKLFINISYVFRLSCTMGSSLVF